MDQLISRWVAESLHTPLLDWLMPFFTGLGEAGFLWILLCVALLCRRRTRRWGVVCATALVISFVSGEWVIKNLVRRARPFSAMPELSLLIAPPHGFSFPSSHAASSFATATAVRVMDRRAGAWALALAALIAFSRVYLSVHYPTDILAGAALGVASAFLARWLWRKKWGEAL